MVLASINKYQLYMFDGGRAWDSCLLRRERPLPGLSRRIKVKKGRMRSAGKHQQQLDFSFTYTPSSNSLSICQ
ncbi:hypothetical protein PISMIDRAFT_154515 [Pisolithus microcarpus 441]|uniref:Uncharacterized protein n=1 Tax=Pisolithus microcarpus 441 TaxID=765257 RepID=A0A0C9ZH47_9AGAM|nr:hypothetical protein PISMIDRAFT_154515 [Pisolithus microcarpus 441]